MMKVSRLPYAETIAESSSAITGHSNRIFATIDQAAAAESVGLSLRPTTLIVFGNPIGGTPLMQAVPPIALELPLKLLVWEENGVVKVAYTTMSEIATRYGVVGFEHQITAIDQALDALTSAVA